MFGYVVQSLKLGNFNNIKSHRLLYLWDHVVIRCIYSPACSVGVASAGASVASAGAVSGVSSTISVLLNKGEGHPAHFNPLPSHNPQHSAAMMSSQ